MNKRRAKLIVGLALFLMLGLLTYGALSTEYPKFGGKVIKVKLENNFLDNPNILGVVMK
ncbi:MAG: hypothetical protein QMC77_02065 [Methanocellales archaeon]|nr:hypothetical protein [Methanocellales archaeon]